MSNADLIERLRKHTCYTAFPKPVSEAADALELADKRIAELEQVNSSKLDEAERKLAVAREALLILAGKKRSDGTYYDSDCTITTALAQIGGDDAG